MGMRSSNALVIGAAAKLSVADKALLPMEVSAVVKGADGALLLTWETNVAPMWARTSTADLEEEKRLFELVLKLSPAHYRWLRVGEELGERGELQDCDLLRHEDFLHVQQQYTQEMANCIDTA